MRLGSFDGVSPFTSVISRSIERPNQGSCAVVAELVDAQR